MSAGIRTTAGFDFNQDDPRLEKETSKPNTKTNPSNLLW